MVKQGNTMSASAIAAALADRPVKRLPHGDYLCPCPAHDDHSPSLSIRDGDPPPLKWSDLRYVFDIKEDCNGKEAIQA
jgi:hypothetical protein